MAGKCALILILILVLGSVIVAVQEPYNTYIIVKDYHRRIITSIVEAVLREGAVVRLNSTHFATYIVNRTELLVFKDGVQVYEMNLTPPPPNGYQVVEVIARVRDLKINVSAPKDCEVRVKYGSVVVSQMTKRGVVVIRQVPYPTRLSIEIPCFNYKCVLDYAGQEEVEIHIREPEYNVYLRFYDVELRPVPVSVVEIIPSGNVKCTYVNETFVAMKLTEAVELKFCVYGVKVHEVTINPPPPFSVKTLEVKLRIGVLKVIAPAGTKVKVTLPSKQVLSKDNAVGEVAFNYVPACKLLITVEKDSLRAEKAVDFPGALTVSIAFTEETRKIDPIMLILFVAIAASLPVSIYAVKRVTSRPPKPKPPKVTLVKESKKAKRKSAPTVVTIADLSEMRSGEFGVSAFEYVKELPKPVITTPEQLAKVEVKEKERETIGLKEAMKFKGDLADMLKLKRKAKKT